MGVTRERVIPPLSVAVILIALTKLVLHLYAGRHYGYFIDELYYLACGRNLAAGYVDQPPLIALIAAAVRVTLGQSLAAIRFLPAVAGAAMVLLTGLIARELSGGRFAQALAALCALVAPGLLGIDSLFTMNAFEPLSWMGCAYMVIRILRTGNQERKAARTSSRHIGEELLRENAARGAPYCANAAKLWLWFGVLAGIGLENKHSMLIFGCGIVVGLLATRERRQLLSPWLWIGGLIAFVIFLPNLLWNVRNHFPFLELQANIQRSHRNVDLPPLKFLAQVILTMLPLTLPVWLAGLWYFFFGEKGRLFRVLGWAWLVVMAIVMIANPRVYYVFPAFPMLFAAGGVQWEIWLAAPKWQRTGRSIAVAWMAAMLLIGAIFAPFAAPLLPVETYIRYAQALHFEPPRIERFKLGPLPQLYADQFGWEDMVAAVARVYNGLPPDVRAKTAIFGQHYGQSGAVDLFGPKYGLPRAISGHQTYYLWGPRGYTGESMIVMSGNQADLESKFAYVEKVAHVGHPYAMPYEHFDIFYCRGLKWPLKDYWLNVKHWD